MKRLLTLSLLLVTALSSVDAATPEQGFVGSFAPTNWTRAPGDGSISFDATTLRITSGNAGSESFTDVYIIAPFAVRLSFDWDYSTADEPVLDPFGVTTSTPIAPMSFTWLTDNLGGLTQTGSFSRMLSAGDLFAFTAWSTDGDYGAATTRITNFAIEYPSVTVPEPSTGALLFAALAAGAVFRRRRVRRPALSR
jgi:PEP-CTERM motif